MGRDGAESEGQGEAGGQGQGESGAESGLATFETARIGVNIGLEDLDLA